MSLELLAAAAVTAIAPLALKAAESGAEKFGELTVETAAKVAGWLRDKLTGRAKESLDRLEGENRVAFRYANGDNPNGSARNIAGILGEKRNVLGLMPHPERVCDPLLGGTDGRAMFESLIEALG